MMLNKTFNKYAVVFLICLLAVITIDLVTNDLNTARYYWDFALYYDMAENGLVHNDNLWAPFVYRFVTPLLAGSISDVLPVHHELVVRSSPEGEMFVTTTYPGFRVVAYLGAVAQLMAVFALAEHFRARFVQALVAVGAVAFSMYSVKFLIFDVSRPDHLAYPLMIVAALALFRRNIIVCLTASCIGLLVREFLIIPPAILMVMLGLEFLKTRSWRTLGWMALVFVSVSLFVIVPRALIPIQGSGQYVDPINESSSISVLINAPRSKRRDLNVLFNLLSYMLPALLLLTPDRVRRAWDQLQGYRLFLFLYTGMVLVFTMYGGTDLWRFMTYMFIPLVILLAVLLKNGDVHPTEILYMLVVVAIYNKMLLPIPNWHGEYLDFYGGYDNRINATTQDRFFEMGTFLFGAVLLRGLLRLARRGRVEKGKKAGLIEAQ
jgi:hypothetical protein